MWGRGKVKYRPRCIKLEQDKTIYEITGKYIWINMVINKHMGLQYVMCAMMHLLM